MAGEDRKGVKLLHSELCASASAMPPLTLASGEGSTPAVSPDAHHQRFSDQIVAFVALDLHGAPGVQVVLLHPAVQHLFGCVAASNRRRCGSQQRLSSPQHARTARRIDRKLFIHWHAGVGRLQVPLARQDTLSGPTSSSPASHT